jgi:iron complex outermembrane receptor protein
MKHLLLLLLTCYTVLLNAQAPVVADSARELQQVVVKAYEQNRQLKEVSAAINYVGKQQLERYNNTSILPALNATPGVRMEERSPGSYRLNIRGSTLRSPFGVRNVKVYWNGIPFTDPGGNTYLNQLSYYNINSIEVIKGPAGSLYGAGTGGALLINSQGEEWNDGVSVSGLLGSNKTINSALQVRLGKDNSRHSLSYSHLESDGYRDHSEMRRDIVSWESRIKTNLKQDLLFTVFYGDLYYQTPGGLTEAQFKDNPRAARGPAGATPGAEEAKAAIYQKTFLAGITHTYRFNENFENTLAVYGAYSDIKNPTFRNYEKRYEPHYGGRTVFKWQKDVDETRFGILFGAEGQIGRSGTKTYANNLGEPGAIQTDDLIFNRTWFAFVQGDLHLPGDWALSAGASINRSTIEINRLNVPSFKAVERQFKSEWSPRVAISKKILPGTLIYASYSQGFSPPTTQEILPSTTVISADLQAEHGVNYEWGIKSSWLQQRLYFEVNAFYFKLKNAIVLRRDSTGADYFDNAGSTKQNGLEWQFYYQTFPRSGRFLQYIKWWASHTINWFRYKDFKQGTTDFSKNEIPSVAHNTVAWGLDLNFRYGFYTNFSMYYSDPIALNDANTAFASWYNLLGGRIGVRGKQGKKMMTDFFIGIDNALDMKYSLGNDINAVGGRYFNAAAGVNYYAGLALQFNAHVK